MNSDENGQLSSTPVDGGSPNRCHWTVCPVCQGRGQKSRKPSKKVWRRYERALLDVEKGKASAPPKPPVAHMDDCTHCQGAGLKEAEETTLLNTDYSSVAIIGGGLSGLALAVACRHRGIPFVIYERDVDFDQRSQGYGLTMQQASKALAGFGIAGLQEGITSTKHVVHRSDGKVVGEWGLRKWGRSPTKAIPKGRNVHVPRQSLRNELLEALGGHDQVQWNHRLVDFHACDGHVDLNFQVGLEVKTVRSDIVVGADGVRSSVRKQWIGDEVSPLRYLDCMVILGICPLENVDASALLDGQTVFQTANGHERMYMMPYSPTTIMWQLSFPIPEEEAKALHGLGARALKEEALRRCPSWHDPIPQVLAETPEMLITGYPAYDRELLTRAWFPVESRVTLIGDAAHPMSPFKGQGANQALLDALSLARTLYKKGSSEGSVTATLREFEAEMLPRSAVKVKASAEAARFLHTDVAMYEGNMSRGDAARVTGFCPFPGKPVQGEL